MKNKQNMFEHIKPTIQRKSKELAGKWIDCKFCQGQSIITLEYRRWRINCLTCGYNGYLKTYSEANKHDLSESGSQNTTIPT